MQPIRHNLEVKRPNCSHATRRKRFIHGWASARPQAIRIFCLLFLISGFGIAHSVSAQEPVDPDLQELTDQLAQEPTRVDLWIARGKLYRSYGRLAESLKDLDQAWLLTPDDPHVTFERGVTLSAMGRDQDAETLLDLLLQQEELAPFIRISALAERAAIRARTGRPGLALEDYTAILLIYPIDRVYYLRGKVLESLGRLNEAAQSYEEGIHVLGDSMLLKQALIFVQITRGLYDEALVLVDEQIIRAPLKIRWYLQRAEILARLGRVDAALQAYELALTEANRMLAQRTTALHLLAKAIILNALGRQDEAVEDLQEALEQASQVEEIKKLLLLWDQV